MSQHSVFCNQHHDDCLSLSFKLRKGGSSEASLQRLLCSYILRHAVYDGIVVGLTSLWPLICPFSCFWVCTLLFPTLRLRIAIKLSKLQNATMIMLANWSLLDPKQSADYSVWVRCLRWRLKTTRSPVNKIWMLLEF